jgi:murein L,D-transpeptidase YafK
MLRVGDRLREHSDTLMHIYCRAIAVLISLGLAGLSPRPAVAIEKADRVLVLKTEHRLLLLSGNHVIKSYPIALGRHPKGPKHWRGDGRTPEGTYVIDRRFSRTPYHLALHISYPSELDRARALSAGRRPGGDILIHGMPQRFGHTDPVRFFRDWTNGCIAVGNIAIEEIWDAVDDGTPVQIQP